MKIKKEDKIIITTGKDKGKEGKVLQVIPKLDKVVVDGLNMRKRHIKPRRRGEKGQIVDVPAPIHISNVMLVCSKCKKVTRVGYSLNKDSKNRICKKCEAVL